MKTSIHTLLVLTVRLGAVLLAVHALESLPRLAAHWATGEQPILSLESGFIATQLLAAVALWLWPGMLVWWVSSRGNREVFEMPIAPAELQAIALAVPGML